MTFKLPRPRTDMIKKSCSYKSTIWWNALESQMRSICDIDAFKKSLKCTFKSHISLHTAVAPAVRAAVKT